MICHPREKLRESLNINGGGFANFQNPPTRDILIPVPRLLITGEISNPNFLKQYTYANFFEIS